MNVFKIYSKRKIEENKSEPDVYQFKTVPVQLSRQIIFIISETLGDDFISKDYYKIILDRYLKELGEFSLLEPLEIAETRYNTAPQNQIQLYLMNEKNIDNWLSLVELVFCFFDNNLREIRNAAMYYVDQRQWNDAHTSPDEAISELNYRFQEHCLGYEFIDGKIIRIDSKEIHKEIIKPALALLVSDSIYSNTNENYRQAFEHYRFKRYPETLVSSCKAFESCMKAICHKRGWTFDDTQDTAKNLIKICLENLLFPQYLEAQMTHLRCILESVATPRNKDGGHGKLDDQAPPKELASYALHFTASTIVFLIECEKILK